MYIYICIHMCYFSQRACVRNAALSDPSARTPRARLAGSSNDNNNSNSNDNNNNNDNNDNNSSNNSNGTSNSNASPQEPRVKEINIFLLHIVMRNSHV